MEDKRIINHLIENNEEEHVEAVPGPAIEISKATYKKMQENNQSKQNRERLKKHRNFFGKIKNETEIITSETISL